MPKETGPAPAAAEGVNVPARERVMPSIAELNKANVAEKSAAEAREKGETPSGHLERIAAEADGRAQEKLLAQNTGLLNRIGNVARRAWDVVKGFGKMAAFVKEDIYNPIKDAAKDFFSGRKEDGEAVGATMEKIAGLQQAIRNTTGEDRESLMKKLTGAEEELQMLRDPHGYQREQDAKGREVLAQEAEQAKKDKVDAKAFMKSEEARMSAEKLAGDVAAAQERHRVKLEREAMERDARVNLGRGAAMLIVKAAGEDPSTMTLSEKELSAIGAVIDGAKSLVRMPEKIRTGVGEYLDDEAAKARGAWRLTRGAVRGVLMADDIEEIVGNLADAGKAAKKVAGASLSLTASALMNRDVQEGVVEALGLEEHAEDIVAGDEEGDGTVEVQSARSLMLKTLKSGAVSSAKLMGKAVTDVYEGVRDSEIVKDYTPAAQKAGRGLKYAALGAGAIVASPILIPGAGVYFAGKGMKYGYEAGTAAASAKLTEMAPAIADKVAPIIESTAQFIDNAMNAKKDGAREFAKIGEDLNAVLLSTAEDINTNTRKAAKAYNTLATRLSALKAGAVALYNKLEADAISEAAKAKNPEVAAGIDDALEELDAIDDIVEAGPAVGADVPEARINRAS